MDKNDWCMEFIELLAEYEYAFGDYAYQLAVAYHGSFEETPSEAFERYIQANTNHL